MTRTVLRAGSATTALLATGLLLAGCSGAPEKPAARPTATPSSAAPPSGFVSYTAPAATSVPTPAATELTDSYFAEGSCAAALPARQGDSTPRYDMVPCSDPRAEAKVIKRGQTRSGVVAALPEGPDCDDNTDIALDLYQNALLPNPTSQQNKAAYACLRDLRDPHPGDPGMGGGWTIVVGDCVYAAKTSAGSDTVQETRCDGKGGHRPEYKVVKRFVKSTLVGLDDKQQTCPDSATVSFTIPNPAGRSAMSQTVACAEPVG